MNDKANVFEIEQFVDSLPKFKTKVYTFMRKEYDLLREAGEQFDDESNDELVEAKASQAFNITKKEAGNIFAEIESKISEFYLEKRL